MSSPSSYTAEFDAFMTTLDAVSPQAATTCPGWTAHELVAHLVAGAAEVGSIVEAHLAGDPVPATRPFDERERPFREMDDRVLRATLVTEGMRLLAALERLHQRNPASVVPFTGWRLTAMGLAIHARSELALHRWDLAGDDEVSTELLSQPELTAHGVAALGALSVLNEAPEQRLRRAGDAVHDGEYHLCCDGQPDVVVSVRGGSCSFHLEAQREGPAVCLDRAARLLLLWGRRPGPASRMHVQMSPDQLRQLQRILHA
jgi:hypothetical protein